MLFKLVLILATLLSLSALGNPHGDRPNDRHHDDDCDDLDEQEDAQDDDQDAYNDGVDQVNEPVAESDQDAYNDADIPPNCTPAGDCITGCIGDCDNVFVTEGIPDVGNDFVVECVTDSDCSNDLFCDGPEFCMDSKCVFTNSPCEPGLICSELLSICYIHPVDNSDTTGDNFDEKYTVPDASCNAASNKSIGSLLIALVFLKGRRRVK